MDTTESVTIQTTSNDNLTFTKQVIATAADDGETKVLADLTCTFSESMMMGGPSLSYSLNVRDAAIITANQAAVQAIVDSFVAEVRTKVGASIPVSI